MGGVLACCGLGGSKSYSRFRDQEETRPLLNMTNKQPYGRSTALANHADGSAGGGNGGGKRGTKDSPGYGFGANSSTPNAAKAMMHKSSVAAIDSSITAILSNSDRLIPDMFAPVDIQLVPRHTRRQLTGSASGSVSTTPSKGGSSNSLASAMVTLRNSITEAFPMDGIGGAVMLTPTQTPTTTPLSCSNASYPLRPKCQSLNGTSGGGAGGGGSTLNLAEKESTPHQHAQQQQQQQQQNELGERGEFRTKLNVNHHYS